jgi:polysaccharide deacetylase 2 family uncharacterized protein YibQ
LLAQGKGPRPAKTALFWATCVVALAIFGCSQKPTRKTVAKKEPPAESRPPRRAESVRKGPRLAIIIDDIGNDRPTADSLLALPYPLTLSILPHLPMSGEIADQTAKRGDQVMLHLPMQPDSPTTPSEPIELRLGMSSPEVRSMLAGMLATVPHVLGVNNHEGSKATSDPALMDALMPALRDRGLFFIDSRTTASTVAADSAHQFGVRAASRKVFLDDQENTKAIDSQIDLAARDAEQNGDAIAIGHPHPETISALRETLPRLKKQGIQLVFASDLVR